MDILYVYRHSDSNDFEIRYSLRRVNIYLPYIRKIGILGDRPHSLRRYTDLVEHERLSR